MASGADSLASTSTMRSPMHTTWVMRWSGRRVGGGDLGGEPGVGQHQRHVSGQRGAVRLAMEEVEQEGGDVLAAHPGRAGRGQSGLQGAIVQRPIELVAGGDRV